MLHISAEVSILASEERSENVFSFRPSTARRGTIELCCIFVFVVSALPGGALERKSRLGESFVFGIDSNLFLLIQPK